jgi:hypothetical protein
VPVSRIGCSGHLWWKFYNGNATAADKLALPCVTVTGIGIFIIDMTQQSLDNITGLTTLALVKTGQGSTDIMAFRDAANVDHDMTPA